MGRRLVKVSRPKSNLRHAGFGATAPSQNPCPAAGATGVGLTTGDSYQATGVTQEQDSIPLINGAAEFTFVNNFKIIGQGPDNNFLVHQTVHQTINANGDVTTTIVDTSVECR